MRWERNVWLDLIKPCVEANFDVSSLPDTVDNESRMMCIELSKHDLVCRQVRQVHEAADRHNNQGEHHRRDAIQHIEFSRFPRPVEAQQGNVELQGGDNEDDLEVRVVGLNNWAHG